MFIGYPVDAINIPWLIGENFDININFSNQVRKSLGLSGTNPVVSNLSLLICRTGDRSYDAAKTLIEDGFLNVHSI